MFFKGLYLFSVSAVSFVQHGTKDEFLDDTSFSIACQSHPFLQRSRIRFQFIFSSSAGSTSRWSSLQNFAEHKDVFQNKRWF